jgi:hypothetical protein
MMSVEAKGVDKWVSSVGYARDLSATSRELRSVGKLHTEKVFIFVRVH